VSATAAAVSVEMMGSAASQTWFQLLRRAAEVDRTAGTTRRRSTDTVIISAAATSPTSIAVRHDAFSRSANIVIDLADT